MISRADRRYRGRGEGKGHAAPILEETAVTSSARVSGTRRVVAVHPTGQLQNVSSGCPSQPVPLRAAVPDSHRAAASPVRHRAPRRAGQAVAARKRRRPSGSGGLAFRVLGPEPVLSSLQAACRLIARPFSLTRPDRKKCSYIDQVPDNDFDTVGHNRVGPGVRRAGLGRYTRPDSPSRGSPARLAELRPGLGAGASGSGLRTQCIGR
jgi:hypothetical protein